jgi:O-antigen ligase
MEKNMYMGDSSLKQKGYQGYNTHNQFLETTLQSGIPGLVVQLLIFLIMFILARGSPISISIMVLLLAWSFTESLLETQYGMLFFFLPLIFNTIPYLNKKEPHEHH